MPAPRGLNAKGYVVNVASARNGVGYGSGWQHIDGWSEAIVDYIREAASFVEAAVTA